MAVLRSLKQTPGRLLEQPILFVPIVALGLLQTPQLFTQTLDPIVSSVVSLGFTGLMLFVMPFFVAGLVGMANDVATGNRTSVGRFLECGKTYYASAFGGYLVVFGISIVLGFAIGIAFLLGVLTFVLLGGGAVAAAAAVLIVGVGVLAYLAVMALFQFFGHAVVIDDARAFDSIKRSVDVVRANVLKVFGYYLVVLFGSGVVGGLYGGMILWLFPPATAGQPAPAPDLGSALTAVSVGTLLTTVAGGLFLVFSVLFYRSITGLDKGETPGSGSTIHL
ncbi:DUF7847 domain-containing protein [Natrarchaeobius chitinivorans]|uniref:DUF7847 domain-containing protein n=1 Tax=Natrarchaeobius chitinivorans TaxID=1679083 RepID=A0A3N6MKU6_NATCH|nr:hypothetical protein [Natrarchaeobius chitinivorans]RQG97880.1 hypothetical protein EA473_01385 [Natrarchaeobius chitinivorans]